MNRSGPGKIMCPACQTVHGGSDGPDGEGGGEPDSDD
jgi:hypothetical protein